MPPPKDPMPYQLWIDRNASAQRIRAARIRGTPEWDEWRIKLSAAMKAARSGVPPTQAQVDASRLNAAKRIGIPLSLERRRKQSIAMTGRKRTPEHQAKLNASQLGRPKSAETRAKISATMQGMPGRTHGESAKASISNHQRIRWRRLRSADTRNCHEYRTWRKAVLSRDNSTCRKCGTQETGKKIHAHHIIEWDDDPSLRFEVSNGLTLCSACHLREHFNSWDAIRNQTNGTIGH